MRLIKIGIANIDTTVGAFIANTDALIDAARRMSEEGCAVGCFQEQVIGGYPAEDLVQWHGFVDAQSAQLERFVQATTGMRSPTVFTVGLTVGIGGDLYNAVAVVTGGRVIGFVPKEKLPTYGVFYENRTFSRGIPGAQGMIDGVPFGDLVFRFPFGVMAAEVCEDIWSPDGPMRRRAYAGAELIVNVSASPFRSGVADTRREMVSTRAADNQAIVAYVNQVGGNDSLVFDGGGFVNQNGRMLAELPRWREQIVFQTVDLDRTTRLRRENTTWRTDREESLKRGMPAPVLIEGGYGPEANAKGLRYPVPRNRSFFMPEHAHGRCPREAYFEDLVEACVMGMDYFRKTKAFRRIGIALSGGKDSVLTLALARIFAEREMKAGRTDDLADFIHCFSMPTRFNSENTRSLARRVAEELGTGFKEIGIEEAFDREVEAAKAMLSPGEDLTPVTLQNIQARIRGQRMWNWANSSGGFWLQTSNMSEKSVGYATVGGDLMGAYSLIANMPKTVVTEVLRYLADTRGWETLRETADGVATAELAADQADETDLMPFPVLDACFALFAGEKMDAIEVLAVVRDMWTDEELLAMRPGYVPGMLEEWVAKFTTLFFASIFKWVLTPEAVHLGGLDLDRERALQLPVVQDHGWAGVRAVTALASDRRGIVGDGEAGE